MDYDLISIGQQWPDVAGQTRQQTMDLRFMNGRLQQAWELRSYGRNGQTVSVSIEWLDVPDATPQKDATP